ncbi:hypothetical protein [Aquimarina litoralis]|uniref:hypothetical protein n=1 Tax=Aquimarina litoralis TaxID=584605 RepID=UPI001C55E595|nr:hypothetical protein [Aquimarina litoralis]MBW1299053.1 hypothetical protein [Aquimarina litoralis]
MSSEIIFLHSHWIIPITICSLVVWLMCIWKEWVHFGKRTFWIRILVAFFAIISIAIIALKPALPALPKNTKIAILTPNYHQEALDSLQKVYKKIKLLTYKENYPILEQLHTLDTIFVLGNGIAPYDFWQLEGYKTTFIKSDIPSGIIKYRYNQKATTGEKILFKGIYNNPKKGARLFLEEPGGSNVDSIILQGNKNEEIQLSTKLKIVGNYTFRITEKDSLGNILSKNPLPIQVVQRKSLRILIVNEFPTFETKYLKNYLAENGHEVLVKTKITKGKFKFEYFNTDRIQIGTFTEKNIESFDLIILDAVIAKNLGKTSKSVLEAAIRNQGLGLFIQPDENLFQSRKSSISFDFKREKNSETRLKDATQSRVMKYPFSFKKEFTLQPILYSTDGAIVAAYKRVGKGRVGTAIFQGTYELLLDGKSTAYKELWSDIINDISKKQNTGIYWDASKTMTRKDQPYEFTVRTSIPDPKVKTQEGYRIGMKRNIDIPSIWKGKTFPKKNGWNHINIAQDTTAVLNYFVVDTTVWRSNMIYHKIQANSRNFDISSSNNVKTNSPVEPINPIGLFVFFISCLGYLWLIPKIT